MIWPHFHNVESSSASTAYVNAQGSFTAKSANVEQHGREVKHVERFKDAKKKTQKTAVSSSTAAPTTATRVTDPVVSHQPGLEVFYGRRGRPLGFLTTAKRATSILVATVAEGGAYICAGNVLPRCLRAKLMENVSKTMMKMLEFLNRLDDILPERRCREPTSIGPYRDLPVEGRALGLRPATMRRPSARCRLRRQRTAGRRPELFWKK